MDQGKTNRQQDSVYSNKVRAGKRRTYFFDVRQTKGNDYYVTLTESTRRYNDDGFERHKIFVYKEDFNRFLEGLTDVMDKVKTDLMPDYDYDEFTRRHQEYEARRLEELAAEEKAAAEGGNEATEEGGEEVIVEETKSTPAEPESVEEPAEESDKGEKQVENEDDMAW